MDTLIKHSDDSALKPNFIGEGSKIELYVFESINMLENFLREVGVSDTFIDSLSRFTPNRQGGLSGLAGQAGQIGQLVATYALAASLLSKILIIKKYTVAKDMGVKRGQTGRLNFTVNPGYLLVVAKNANTILLTAQIKPGKSYSFRAIDTNGKLSGELTAS